MRTLRTSPCLLILPLCLAGCASTTGGVSTKMKTVASVGDKQLPVVTGAPGSSVVADVQAPERPMRSEGRISGRVFDENGNPLPNVRVRLAVGNTPGGKLSNSTTDRTGAFTLNGLRSGSAYTVIAESESGQDYFSGRSDVRAPDTDVRITLSPEDVGTQNARASKASDRVRPVSERDQLPDEEPEIPRLSAGKPRVNVEDLPPALEAEVYDPPEATRAPAPALAPSRPSAPARGDRWRPVGSNGVTQQMPRQTLDREFGPASATQDPEAREVGVLAATPLAEDDGPNPLPPALEPDELPALEPEELPASQEDVNPLPPARERRRSASKVTDDTDPLPPAREPGQMSVTAPVEENPVDAVEEPDTAPEPSLSEGSPLPPAVEPSPESGPPPAEAELPAPALEPEQESPPGMPSDSSFLPPVVEAGNAENLATAPAAPSPEAPAGLLSGLPAPVEAPPEGLPAPAPAATAVAPAQGLAGSTPFETSPFEASPFESSPFDSAPSDSTSEAVNAPALAAAASDQSVFETSPEPAAADAAAPPDTRKRPTWKDLAALAPKAAKSPEGLKRAVSMPAAAPAIARQPTATQISTRAGPPPQQVRADLGEAFCDYDTKHRKINDFRLPDLEGRPVRFQELDADLVLIDFWGTWCQPCLKSIPHLVDLQKRMGSTKFKVVGIACEQGPPAEQAKKVATEVARLGINYPVLMSGMDGPCPLQDALKVQSYPTLILVDREGRILWRDQGATPVTLARLDRILTSASKSDTVRRY